MLTQEQRQNLLDAGYSVEKIKAYEKAKGIAPVERKPGFFEEAGQDIKQTFNEATEAVAEGIRGAEEAQERTVEGEQNLLSGTLQTIGSGLRAGAEVIGSGIRGIGRTFLPQSAEEKIGETVTSAAEFIGQTEPVQNIIKRYNQLDESTRRNIDAALGVGEGLGTILGAQPAVTALKRGVTKTTQLAFEKAITPTIRKTGNLVEKVTPSSIRIFNRNLPKTRDEAIEALTQSYHKSFIENRKSINSRLEKIANKASFEDKNVTRDSLLRDLAEEGYIPIVEGRLAKFDKVFDDIDTRQQQLMSQIDPVLEKLPDRISLDSIKNDASDILRDSPQVGAQLDQSLAELDRFINSYKTKYGNNLTPVQVNQIRKEMNARTKAFGQDQFMQDTADALADATRDTIDSLQPGQIVREANEEWARLKILRDTAGVFHNEQIDVGILGRALGSYAGTIAASGLGLSVGGPGGLVIAGLAAHYGGDVLADFLRNIRFNPKIRDLIIQQVRSDDEIVRKLIEEADDLNKQFLERTLLPPPSQTPIPQPARGQARPSEVRAVPARKGEPGRNPQTGKFFRTFRSD